MYDLEQLDRRRFRMPAGADEFHTFRSSCCPSITILERRGGRHSVLKLAVRMEFSFRSDFPRAGGDVRPGKRGMSPTSGGRMTNAFIRLVFSTNPRQS